MPAPETVALIIFARAPRPGHTKTRLIPALGPGGSARLYAAFLKDTLARANALDGFEVEVWAAAEADQAFFDSSRLQEGADLGERMSHALQDALTRHERALVIGTDAPTLPEAHLVAAGRALEAHDVVLGPSADGGYYLIGARAPAPRLEGVRWSSAHTLDDTVASLRGRRLALLRPWYDVDTPGDLRLLRAHLALRPAAAPATAEALAATHGAGIATDFDPLLSDE